MSKYLSVTSFISLFLINQFEVLAVLCNWCDETCVS